MQICIKNSKKDKKKQKKKGKRKEFGGKSMG